MLAFEAYTTTGMISMVLCKKDMHIYGALLNFFSAKFLFFEIGFLCVALDVLELAL